MTLNKKLIFVIAMATAVQSAFADQAQPKYAFKKYIPSVVVADAPNNGNANQSYGSLTLSTNLVSLPKVADSVAVSSSVLASNFTDKPVTVSNISVTGGFSSSYYCGEVSNTPVTIEPGKNCLITVSGSGSSYAAKIGTLIISYASGGGVSASVTMPKSSSSATVTSSVSLLNINGGDGLIEQSASFRILNSGETAANLSNIYASDSSFSVRHDCFNAVSGELPANQYCTIIVSRVGTANQVSTNVVVGYDNKSVVVPVVQTAAVSNTAGSLTTSVSSLTFDSKNINESSSKSFILSNSSSFGVTVNGVTVPSNSGYTASVTCPGALPYVLTGSATCTVTVGTTSLSTAQSSTVVVNYNSGGTKSVSVSTPAGIAPSIDLDASAFNFETFNLDAGSNLTKTVTVSNNGTADLNITNLSLTGTNADKFSLSGTCSVGVLAKATSCTLVVTAKTDTAGGYFANVNLTTDYQNKNLPVFSTVTALGVDASLYVAGTNSGSIRVSGVGLGAASAIKVFDSETLIASSSSVVASSGSVVGTFSSTPSVSKVYTVKVYAGASVLGSGSAFVSNQVTLSTTDATGAALSSINFGSTAIAAQKTVRIANVANAADLIVSGVIVQGSGPYTATGPVNAQGGATCSDLSNMIIPAGGSCDVVVNMAQTSGAYTQSLRIVSNATASTPVAGSSSVSLPITGTGTSTTDVSLVANPTSVSFGAGSAGATASKSFVVTNNANWNTVVNSVTVSPANSYTTALNCSGGTTSLPKTLAKNEFCQVTVTTTYGAAAQSSNVVINYNNTSLSIPVTTPVQTVGAVSLSSGTLSLSAVSQGSTATGSLLGLNLSGVPVTINNIQVDGGFSASYNCAGSTTLPVTLQPDDQCLFNISGVGSSSSALNGKLTVTYAYGNTTVANLQLARSAVPANLLPGTNNLVVNGGDGITSQTASFNVLNTGEESATISSVLTTGAFTTTENCTANSGLLPYNLYCTINVTGLGTTTAKSGSITINYNGGKSAVVNVTQNAAVNNNIGALSISPLGALAFSGQDAGSVATKTLTLTNSSDWGTTLNVIAFPNGSGYTSSLKCNGQTTALPYVLNKNSSCDITVGTTFTSSTQATTLTITYNSSSNATVNVTTDAGYAPLANLDVSQLTYGGLNQEASLGAQKTVTLSNNGNKVLNITGRSLSGTNPAAFSINAGSTCGATLTVGSSCSILVDAITTSTGSFAANLNVNTDGGNKVVPLTSAVYSLSVQSANMVANSSSSSFTAVTDTNAPGLSSATSVKLYDTAETSLKMTSSSVSWSAGTRTLSVGFNTVTPAVGTYKFQVLNSSGVVLGKGTLTVFNPRTLNLLDINNNTVNFVDFGQVSVPSQKTLRISNVANASSITVTNVTVNSSGNPFTIGTPTNALGGATCTSVTTIVLPAGGSCDIPVNLAQIDGDYNTGYSITVTSNAAASNPNLGTTTVTVPVKGSVVSVIDPNYGSTITLLDASSGTLVNKAPGGTVTIVGATVASTPTKTGSKTVYFNGSGAYVDIGSNQAIGTGDFTIEAWYYYISDSNGEFITALTGGPRMRSMGAKIQVWDSAGTMYETPLTSNAWTHLALVRRSGVSNLYKNGVSVANFIDSNNYSANYSARISQTPPNWGYYTRAYMEQVRVTKAARYTSNFTPSPYAFANQSVTTDSTPIASGGTVTYNGNYAIHTFYGSGTFQFTNAPIGNTATAYVVGGGGGGGSGGGGGGAVNTFALGSSQVTAGTSYTVTVGAGGAGAVYPGSGALQPGNTGGTTSFGSMTAAGGGGGGGYSSMSTLAAKAGSAGSGGGGGACGGTGQNFVTGGTSTGGGFNGGNGTAQDGNAAGGGGGGASSAGTNASVATPGNGGAGKTVTFQTSVFSGIFGAGGAGMPCNGTTTYTTHSGFSTGNGGKAAAPQGGNGGSGVVVVIYQYK